MSLEIFISYRRKDTGGYAGRLYSDLVQKFGKELVLFDVEVEGTAEELREWVDRVVPNSAVALILIGGQWVVDNEGQRRLFNKDDIVRREIELVLKHRIPILPILVDAADFPSPNEIPESIRSVVNYKGYELSNSFWERKFAIVLQAITSVLKNHLPILKRGPEIWNSWRSSNPDIQPNLEKVHLLGEDLRGFDFSNANLTEALLNNANLSNVDLSNAKLDEADFNNAVLRRANLVGCRCQKTSFLRADLSQADLSNSDFSDADLTQANLSEAKVIQTLFSGARLRETQLSRVYLSETYLAQVDLYEANLPHANLERADLGGASLIRTNLSGANLESANLSGANLYSANVDGAKLTGAWVHGVSATNVSGDCSDDRNLIITPRESPVTIVVDSLVVASVVFLLLDNASLRSFVDTLTTKAVLLAGKWREEQNGILHAVRKSLRTRGYVPILCEVGGPYAERDYTETLLLLTQISRFVIADLSMPRSTPSDLASIVAKFPNIPIVPVIDSSTSSFAMFSDLAKKYPWVLDVYRYKAQETLAAEIGEMVIEPAENARLAIARKGEARSQEI